MNFSIITCTYNPDQPIFERLVNAVNKLETNENVNFEWLIVDNNSSYEVDKIPFVYDALISHSGYRSIREVNPGLTSARIAGIKESKNDWIIFFDDDNEPESSYLINANNLILENPKVACWGAGNISVEFMKRPPSSWLLNKKEYFQERHITGEIISSDNNWQTFYPQGTGLTMNKRILLKYVYYVENKQFNLCDRKGKSLSSGGDVQIVLSAIKLGYFVGISSNLCLNHLISFQKSSFNYLLKLCYGTSSSFILAYNEALPNNAFSIIKQSDRIVLKKIIGWIRFHKLGILSKDVKLKIATQMGEINAHCVASPTFKKPILIRFFEWLIKY